MSRIIKYRVWDEEKKKYCTEYNAMTLKHDGEFCIERGWCIISGGFEVEQYTGLKDKNGKEIYGGDIVANGTLTGVVEYKVDNFCAWTVGATTNGIVLLSGSWTVIGNIHENPELIGR